ncbi:low molecular weight phosphotyrosine protein phosphatase [Pullulanibacillus sp. KACC 23026]|uniref:low molecular weight protein-tyrosine-phosphatase n=1 Tax=Pullulanibacillus sp. KACC 23026 TaxID=3028315 RepID=UPI0023AF1DD6|nr:low molecular weight protein-tyrosine-phosphatase [Pullulanibacillus sp. KACC 23026]WEG12297.1 low molecular weight phosphotyrosine protein phosphatase [Pullulanibacillus sp. KACC 23026]
MIRVLFVCLGNICRSPMAEAVFRELVKNKGLAHLIEIDSAGTGKWHIGEAPHRGTQRLLREKGIDYSTIKAREFQEKDFSDFQYLVAMDQKNVQDMKRKSPKSTSLSITRLLDECPHIQEKDVPDPWYTGDFEETYRLVKAGTEALLDRIIKENHLEEEVLANETD